ncbi:MAG: 7TM diverse intracellular signaling domain-containing protein [Flavobacteriales bacterium]|jgi:signal transduction histidine kinase|nr:7TM diverse intracellular signaling domain-containing protein [Flavobacteriales bacterium]
MRACLSRLPLLFVAIGPTAVLVGQEVRFDGSHGHSPIGLDLAIYHDSTEQATLYEVATKVRFTPLAVDVPNLGVGTGAHWLRTTISNASESPTIVLLLDNPEIDHVDVHVVHDGRPLHNATAGLGEPAKTGIRNEPGLIFDLPIGPGQTADLYIRLQSNKQLIVPVILETVEQNRRTLSLRNIARGTFMGIIAALVLYNFLIFLAIRDRSYLRYVVYILLVGLTQLTMFGVTPALLWPDNTWVAMNASLLLTLATATAASEFARSFLETRRATPWMDRGTRVFYGMFAVGAVLYTTGNPVLGYQLSQAMAGIFAFYVLIMILRTWRRGNRQAGLFLLAWAVFLLGTLVFVLKDMGMLPYNQLTIYTMPVGSALEGILLSLVLADRINILRREKEQSQALALATSRENERIIREQNTLLEIKVRERTRDLEQSNEHLKRTQTQLVSAEKMASLGQLTAGIAHEINNPINFITSNIQPLRRNIRELLDVMGRYQAVEPAQAADALIAIRRQAEDMGLSETIAELDEIIDSIAEGSARTAEIVRGLRNFSRLDQDDLKEADLNEGLRSTLAILAPQYRNQVAFELDLEELPRVECYPGRLNQVFMNILTNSVQAVLARCEGGTPTIRVRTRPAGDQVEITITDNGIGMTDQVKARIFDPFYTTKDVGEGTGLGLAIAYGIIEDHQATIRVDSAPGLGTAFRIAVPVRHRTKEEKRA